MPVETLNHTFAALADPTRRAILLRLTQGDALLKDLAEPFDMSLPAVGKHVKVLEQAGLVSRRKEAQRRPCHLETAPLREVHGWLEAYRAFWEGRFQALDAVLETMQPFNEEPST